jgi:predicted ATP-dependent protease
LAVRRRIQVVMVKDIDEVIDLALVTQKKKINKLFMGRKVA